ncbi:MAG: hypothetical protein KGL39_03355 [Patescibacteria group bacterium]|nr:hypothetical protein [Patescibacteria group bacterium]
MRVYTMTFANVSVSAVEDLLALYAGASAAFEVHEFVIGQITGTTVANLRFTANRLPATVTAGSGGAAGTINKARSGDAAATVTGRTNDTTQATTSGTKVVIRADVYNTINGYQFLPAPEDRPACNPSEAFVVSLDQAPGSAETMNGSITFGELVPA